MTLLPVIGVFFSSMVIDRMRIDWFCLFFGVAGGGDEGLVESYTLTIPNTSLEES